MAFFTGFGVSAVTYYLLNVFFPVPGFTKTFEEVDISGYLSGPQETNDISVLNPSLAVFSTIPKDMDSGVS